MLVTEVTSCRSCGSTRLDTVIDLGNLCVSDFVKDGDQEDRAPLELVVCQDCALVQLRHTVDRDRLYGSYFYRSGTNESMVEALRDVVRNALSLVRLDHDDEVLDIGSNDGTLLDLYPQEIVRVGFEPSNLALDSAKKGHVVYQDYFPSPIAERKGKYKIITSIACFYDVDKPNEFVAAIKENLHHDGVWICQFQDLDSMLAVNGFDNICHEHLTYWGVYAFYHLVARHGLKVIGALHNRTNGGSVRYIVAHGDWTPPEIDRNNAMALRFRLDGFARQIERQKTATVNLLRELRREEKIVVGYGASTKGNTLLQYYGITSDDLPMIADRNPDKEGLLTVGTHIPIVSEETMRRHAPDYLFVLPWHFIDSFVEREKQFLDRGGKFILPLPRLRIIGGDTHADLQPEDTPAEAGAGVPA